MRYQPRCFVYHRRMLHGATLVCSIISQLANTELNASFVENNMNQITTCGDIDLHMRSFTMLEVIIIINPDEKFQDFLR